MTFIASLDVMLCDWLSSKYQQTNFHVHQPLTKKHPSPEITFSGFFLGFFLGGVTFKVP